MEIVIRTVDRTVQKIEKTMFIKPLAPNKHATNVSYNGKGDNWEIGADIPTPLHTNEVTNKNIRYRKRHSVLCNDPHGSGIQKKVDVFTRMADSLCCTELTQKQHCKSTTVQ